MIPQTRHYVNRAVLYAHFEVHFENKKQFQKATSRKEWGLIGVPTEPYRNIIWVSGASHSVSPYAMKEVSGLGSFLLHKDRIKATRATVLYHRCKDE